GHLGARRERRARAFVPRRDPVRPRARATRPARTTPCRGGRVSTFAALADAARDARRAWRLRASLGAVGFAVAAFAPLVFGDSRLADFAGGLYLAVAATGLAF